MLLPPNCDKKKSSDTERRETETVSEGCRARESVNLWIWNVSTAMTVSDSVKPKMIWPSKIPSQHIGAIQTKLAACECSWPVDICIAKLQQTQFPWGRFMGFGRHFTSTLCMHSLYKIVWDWLNIIQTGTAELTLPSGLYSCVEWFITFALVSQYLTLSISQSLYLHLSASSIKMDIDHPLTEYHFYQCSLLTWRGFC